MNKDELNQLTTVKDLEVIYQRFVNVVQGMIDKNKTTKEFYSPKEFSSITGLKYSTVVYRCKVGKLKARQDSPNCSWQIHASEIEKFRNEANQNVL